MLTIENGRHVTDSYKPLSLKNNHNKEYNHLLLKIYICSFTIIKEYSFTTSNNEHICTHNVQHMAHKYVYGKLRLLFIEHQLKIRLYLNKPHK